jgi:hypothetical protein
MLVLLRRILMMLENFRIDIDRLLGLSSSPSQRVKYGWVPAAQTVYGGNTPISVPAGYIHQSAEPHGGPDIEGVYVEPIDGWSSMVWRWADTVRVDAIQRAIGPGGNPAYRMEIAQTDGSSSGTTPGSPRAELYSVDPAEKRRGRVVTSGQFFNDGDEYWATFAVYLPTGFPGQDWSTLFQRKLDDRFFDTCIDQNADPQTCKKFFMSWLSINVHPAPGSSTQSQVDASVPGYPAWTKDPGGAPDFVKICNLADITDRWAQFIVHEKVSSGNDGVADVELIVAGKSLAKVQVAPFPETPPQPRPTFPTPTYKGDVYGHFQYGYYRTNAKNPPTAAVTYSPLLIKRGPARGTVPPLP